MFVCLSVRLPVHRLARYTRTIQRRAKNGARAPLASLCGARDRVARLTAAQSGDG